MLEDLTVTPRDTRTVPSFSRGEIQAPDPRESSTDFLLAHVAKTIGYKSLRRYKARCQFIFDGVPLRNKHVLDVGSGSGGLTFWAALHGAASVVALEPEADGSLLGSASTLQTLTTNLELEDTIHIDSAYLQDAAVLRQGPFGVAILYDVINHLDESAVVSLPGEEAVRRYVATLAHLRRVLASDALVVIADSGRHNLWNQLGLRSPFARTIEWNKHQQPETWIPIFRRSGFELCDLRWSPIYPLGSVSSHRFLQYAFASHFVLRFRVANPTR